MGRRGNESPDAVYIEGVTAIRETEKAILVRFEDGDEHWVPKSVLHDDSEVWADSDEGVLAVKEWFAEKEGWA